MFALLAIFRFLSSLSTRVRPRPRNSAQNQRLKAVDVQRFASSSFFLYVRFYFCFESSQKAAKNI